MSLLILHHMWDEKYKELQLHGFIRQYEAYYKMDLQTFKKLWLHEIKRKIIVCVLSKITIFKQTLVLGTISIQI